jgi:hypothetical protein
MITSACETGHDQLGGREDARRREFDSEGGMGFWYEGLSVHRFFRGIISLIEGTSEI